MNFYFLYYKKWLISRKKEDLSRFVNMIRPESAYLIREIAENALLQNNFELLNELLSYEKIENILKNSIVFVESLQGSSVTDSVILVLVDKLLEKPYFPEGFAKIIKGIEQKHLKTANFYDKLMFFGEKVHDSFIEILFRMAVLECFNPRIVDIAVKFLESVAKSTNNTEKVRLVLSKWYVTYFNKTVRRQVKAKISLVSRGKQLSKPEIGFILSHFTLIDGFKQTLTGKKVFDPQVFTQITPSFARNFLSELRVLKYF